MNVVLCVLGIFQYYYALKAATEGYLFHPKTSTVILQKKMKEVKNVCMSEVGVNLSTYPVWQTDNSC